MARQIITSVAQLEAEWIKDFRKDFSSSARNLEQALNKKGIVPPVKIHYNYVLPNNMRPEEFEKILKKVWLHLIFKTDRVKLTFDINDSTLEEMEKMYQPFLSILNNWVIDIKNNNPDLRYINTTTINNKLGLVDGACYGFNPSDIRAYINNDIKHEDTIKFEEILENITGSTIGYKIASENIKKIAEAAEKKVNTSKCATDEFNTLDPTGFLRFTQGRDDDL